MPPRSNEFQALVYFLRKELGGESATVTESAMVPHVDGGEREVDVLVEGELGGMPVKVGIEVRDHARRQPVTWIEQEWARFLHLPSVDKLVLVSKSGFTKQAKLCAARHGIEVLSYEEASEEEAALRLLYRAELELTEGRAQIERVAIHLRTPSGEPLWILGQQNHSLFSEDGQEVSSVGVAIFGLLGAPETVRSLREAGGIPEAAEGMDVGWNDIQFKNGSRIFMRETSSSELHALETAEIRIAFKRLSRSKVKLAHGRIGKHPVSWGTVRLLSGDATVVVANAQVGSAAVQVRTPHAKDIKFNVVATAEVPPK